MTRERPVRICEGGEVRFLSATRLPLSKAGFLDWFYIPVGAPLPLEFLFDPGIHVHEPLDRTKQPARQ